MTFPTAAPTPVTPDLCTNTAINNEPEILLAYSPSVGQSAGITGQIKVWVTDEAAPMIAPGEVVDPGTGFITTPGDRTIRNTNLPQNSKTSDNLLIAPALYIAPATAESGGTPYFPAIIKGQYNNTLVKKGAAKNGPPIDPPPAGSHMLEYNAEYIWNVTDLRLAPGTYLGEFVILDGDYDRAVGCVTITI
jgi:hypothetical protein